MWDNFNQPLDQWATSFDSLASLWSAVLPGFRSSFLQPYNTNPTGFFTLKPNNQAVPALSAGNPISAPDSTGSGQMAEPFPSKYFNSASRTEVFGQTPGEYGNDYAMPVGTPLKAMADGIVYMEDMGKSDWGKRVFLKMSNGWTMAIGHLTGFGDIQDGQRVSAGTVLGFSGGDPADPSSGQSTGPHIEYQLINPQGGYVDPLNFLTQMYNNGWSSWDYASSAFPSGAPSTGNWSGSSFAYPGNDGPNVFHPRYYQPTGPAYYMSASTGQTTPMDQQAPPPPAPPRRPAPRPPAPPVPPVRRTPVPSAEGIGRRGAF